MGADSSSERKEPKRVVKKTKEKETLTCSQLLDFIAQHGIDGDLKPNKAMIIKEIKSSPNRLENASKALSVLADKGFEIYDYYDMNTDKAKGDIQYRKKVADYCYEACRPKNVTHFMVLASTMRFSGAYWDVVRQFNKWGNKLDGVSQELGMDNFKSYFLAIYADENGKFRPNKILPMSGDSFTMSANMKNPGQYFRDVKTLGKGSFGVVKLVESELGHPYAQKEIKLSEAEESKNLDVVLREIRILESIEHPNILKIFLKYEEEEEGSMMLILPFMPCLSLGDLIKMGGKLSLDLTKFYTVELVKAIYYLRKKKIIHRDLKPDNIMVDPCFHVKISDLGCSIDEEDKHYNDSLAGSGLDFDDLEEYKVDSDDQEDFQFDFDDETKSAKTTESHVGTPNYIAPEMCKYFKSCLDSDLWALGLIVHECLTGKCNFKGVVEKQKTIMTADIKFPKGFDKNAKDFIQKLCQVNPDKRLGSYESGNNINDILDHSFLSDIDHTDIQSQIPSVPKNLISGVNNLDY